MHLNNNKEKEMESFTERSNEYLQQRITPIKENKYKAPAP
jgi:hypothetical protein